LGYRIGLIKKWTRYKKSLRSLRRVVLAERHIFENACYKLFQAVFGADSEITRKLFQDKEGAIWSDKSIESMFYARLGKDTWEIYIGIVEEIRDILGRLLVELRKNISLPVSQVLGCIYTTSSI